MRFILVLILLVVGCGDDSPSAKEQAQDECAKLDREMPMVLGCHICDDRDVCVDEDQRYYGLVQQVDDQWTCEPQLIAPSAWEASRFSRCSGR